MMSLSSGSETSRSRGPSVVIIGDHNAANRGDQAILKGLLHVVQEAYTDPNITVLSNKPEAVTHFTQCQSVQSAFFGWSLRDRTKRRFVRAWCNGPLRPLARLLLGSDCLTGLKLIRDADLVLMKGGSVFTSVYGRRVMAWFKLLDIAMRLGKPVAVCGQSVGPLDDPYLLRAAKRIFPRVDKLIVREQDSLCFVQENVGVLQNLSKLPDTAFFMPPKAGLDPAAALGDEGIDVGRRPLVTISVRELGRFLSLPGVTLTQSGVEGVIAEAADHMIEKHGCSVVFAGTCTGCFGYAFDDRVIAMRVLHLMRNRRSARLLTDEYDSEELAAIYGLASLNIGMRMHSNILAMVAGTPSVGVAYEHKTSGIFRDLGLGKWWIGIDKLDAKRLCAMLDDAWCERVALAHQTREAVAVAKSRFLDFVNMLRGLLPAAQHQVSRGKDRPNHMCHSRNSDA